MRASEGFLVQPGCSRKFSMRVRHFKFDIWIRVDPVEEQSGRWGQRTYV